MMTRIPRQDSDQEDGPRMPPNKSASTVAQQSSAHLSADEASEKPVREKLKKTSIASIPRHNLDQSRIDQPSELDKAIISKEPAQRSERYSVSDNDNADNDNGNRGRPVRKRSFDDLENGEDESITADQSLESISSPQARKRSRDLRSGEGLEAENQSDVHSDTPVQRKSGQNKDVHEMNEPDSHYRMGNIQSVAPISDPEPTDLEMKDSILSPRKKRSRDQLDTDTDREQKIVATEEAKAQRRSEESERDDLLQNVADAASQQEKSASGDPSRLDENSRGANHDLSATTNKPTEGLGTTHTFPRFSSGALSNPSQSRSPPYQNNLTQNSQTSQDPFSASGFGALSGSSTSPFGTIRANSKTTQITSFGSAFSQPSLEISRTTELQGKPTDPLEPRNSSAITPSGLLGFETSGASAFSLLNSSKLNSFGNSTFGSGFGTALGGVSKLSSFAAPVGDANWGDENAAIKSFAAPLKDEEGDEGSESEEEGPGDITKDEDTSDVDTRFQQQDVGTGEDGEESIFSSSRANLYSWNGSAWKEGGRGTFKLNVALPREIDNEFQKSGRFIMRAHQTFRVILNAPIFKQMKIGDSKGNEPTGKSLSFSVIENGKPTPYLIKMSDEGESKTLYQEVRKLQQAL